MASSPLGPVPGLGYSDLARDHVLVRLSDGGATSESSPVAEEVPVAVAYNNEPFVVLMASPGDLEDLAVGISVTESVVDEASEVERIDVVRHSRGIELQIRIPDRQSARLTERRRGISARTGCGVCGIESIDEVLRPPVPVDGGGSISREALWRAAEELEQRQPLNSDTRAVHAAGFADTGGHLQVVREDVGRHNALDKVIGSLLRSGHAGPGFLIVTSRASYELVQKTASAGIPILAAISRPTSLAIQLATQANITLVGLLRGRSANVYSHPTRLLSPSQNPR
jgi:FdhD protein